MIETDNVVQKTDVSRRADPIRILLVYPNTKGVAQANLGFQRVHALLNRTAGVECDQYSLPVGWNPEILQLEPSERLSHEWGWMPDRFDMIAFSISFEPDYLNVALILDYFRLPLERKERNASHPLVLAGGSAIFINPEPLADCIDVFFIGEGEGLTEPFFRLFADAEWNDPREMLRRAATIRGVYVPQFYHQDYSGDSLIGHSTESGIPERVDRHWVERSADLRTHSEVHNGDSAFKDMSLMEVTRGCIWACRFCTAGFIYRPPRLPNLNLTYQSLERVLEEQGGGGLHRRTCWTVGDRPPRSITPCPKDCYRWEDAIFFFASDGNADRRVGGSDFEKRAKDFDFGGGWSFGTDAPGHQQGSNG